MSEEAATLLRFLDAVQDAIVDDGFMQKEQVFPTLGQIQSGGDDRGQPATST
jgi:hypothetical protein